MSKITRVVSPAKAKSIIAAAQSKGYKLVQQRPVDGNIELTFVQKRQKRRRYTGWLIGLFALTSLMLIVFIYLLLTQTSGQEAESELIDLNTSPEPLASIPVQTADTTSTMTALPVETATSAITPTPSLDPSPTQMTSTAITPATPQYYEAAEFAPENYQTFMTQLDTEILALSGVEQTQDLQVNYERSGYFFTGKVRINQEHSPEIATAIRQVARTLLAEYYGSYPFFSVSLLLTYEGVTQTWWWDSETDNWIAHNTDDARLQSGYVAGSHSGERYYVSVATANIRLGPGQTFEVIDTLNADMAVWVIFQHANWFYVDYRNRYQGWIASDVVTSGTPATSFQGSAYIQTATAWAAAPRPVYTCDCSRNAYDCSDLGNNAWDCYSYCVGLGYGDVHNLDGDSDGRPCE